MEIKILGTGCPKCKKLEELARQAAAGAGVEATITKVEDISAIMRYPIASTPALVVNEVVKSAGRLPRTEEIITWIIDEAAK